MTLSDRIRALVDALPSDVSAVTLTRADLLAMLAGEESPGQGRDLTVDDIAAEVGRAPSTVRTWLVSGELRGYKLKGKAWRVPRSALEDFLHRQANPQPEPSDDDVDITRWRQAS